MEAFWNAFRDDDGSHLGFQAILNILKDKRDEVDNADAQAAVRFFRGNLDHPDAKGAFRYTKTGQSFLLSKPSVIAQRWRALLAANDGLRERHEEAIHRDDGLHLHVDPADMHS